MYLLLASSVLPRPSHSARTVPWQLQVPLPANACMYRHGLPSNRSITTLFSSPPHQNLNPFMRTAATAEPNPCLVSLNFFFSLTLSKPPWHDQLARYHYRQQSFVTPYSSQIELGWERRLLDHSFFPIFAASSRCRCSSARRSVPGTDTRRARLCLLVFPLHGACSLALHRARTSTSREPESH